MFGNQVEPLPTWPTDLHDEADAEQAVGFHTQIAYCRESDSQATVYLLRTGQATDSIKVTVSVGTAKHTWGHTIAMHNLSVVFNVDERIVPLIVPLSDGDTWDLMNEATLEIVGVRALAAATTATGTCALLSRANTLKIKAIDDDYWPSNKVVTHDETHTPKTEQSLGASGSARSTMVTRTSKGFWLLLKEFVRERWRSRGWKPRVTACYIMLQAFWHVAQLYLYKVIIDECILGGNNTLLIIICVGMVVMELAMWLAEYKIVDYRGNTGTRRDLRNWMIRYAQHKYGMV